MPPPRTVIRANEFDATPMAETGLAAAVLGWPVPTMPFYHRYSPLQVPPAWYKPSIPHQYQELPPFPDRYAPDNEPEFLMHDDDYQPVDGGDEGPSLSPFNT